MPSIRPATETDADAIGRVHEAAIRARASEAYSERQTEAWVGPEDADGPDFDDPETYLVVAEGDRDGAVVGFGRLDVDEAEVSAVYVHPAAADNGIGTAILHDLEREARDRGLETLTLYSSLNAVEFYRQQGYTPVERTDHETTQGVVLEVVQFEKSLS